jgi:hypothetical protein
VLKQKFGDKMILRNIAPSRGWGLSRLGFGTIAGFPDSALAAIEARALWSKFGL